MRGQRFWHALADEPVDPRRRILLARPLDGLDGQRTTSKWAQIARCPQDTAPYDVERLIGRGLLARSAAGGRSTRHALVGVEA